MTGWGNIALAVKIRKYARHLSPLSQENIQRMLQTDLIIEIHFDNIHLLLFVVLAVMVTAAIISHHVCLLKCQFLRKLQAVSPIRITCLSFDLSDLQNEEQCYISMYVQKVTYRAKIVC